MDLNFHTSGGQIFKHGLGINELGPGRVYDRTLWCNLIHVADPA